MTTWLAVIWGGKRPKTKILGISSGSKWRGYCNSCSRLSEFLRKKATISQTLGRLRTHPLDRLFTDIMGLFPNTQRGNKYIFTATDYFSNWVEFFPIPDQRAATTIRVLLNKVIRRYGCLESIHSDQGRNYECNSFSGTVWTSRNKEDTDYPSSPQCNGKKKRLNRTLIKIIKSYIKEDKSEWNLYLGCFGAAYRSSVQESACLTPNLLQNGVLRWKHCEL